MSRENISSYEEYCFIYLGCQWAGYTEKIAHFFHIDASTVSHILRGASYVWYKEQADREPQEVKEEYIESFKKIFNIKKEPNLKDRVIISEEEYFICFCIATFYGRGIENALSKYFNKHKSFLSNGLKSKKGKIKNAFQKYSSTELEEARKIAIKYFNEWKIQTYTNTHLYLNRDCGTEKWVKLREHPES